MYTLTKRDADQVAAWLNLNGVTAKACHSKVEEDEFENSHAYKLHLENLLLQNKIKALVATTALGMGYDKPDLGFVVPFPAPGSIVAYYQQVGRAGRATEYAVGLLMTGREDDDIHDFFRRSAFPRQERVTQILNALAAGDGVSIR